jgi:hypothetical protein
VRFPSDAHIEEVRQFVAAGGINVWLLPGGAMDVEVPVGCVRTLYGQLIGPALHKFSAEEAVAFCIVSRSNVFDKGHAFERIVACDLTMFGTPLYGLLIKHLAPLGPFSCDPLIFASPFAYMARIAQSPWDPHHVYCVKDDPQFKDQDVDIGFPLVQAVEPRSVMRVLLQLSTVADPNENWKKCFQFFEQRARLSNCVLCYMSLCEFQLHTPRQVQARGLSAHDARAQVLQALESSHQLLVLDGALLDKWLGLPVHRIMKELHLPDDVVRIVHGVSTL